MLALKQVAGVERGRHQQIELQREVVGERRRQLGDEHPGACQLQPAAWFACNRNDLAGGVGVPLRREVADRVLREILEADDLLPGNEVEPAVGLERRSGG